MTTRDMGDERNIELEGAWNVRDLGGLPTESGRRVRRGALLRASDLGRLTPNDWTALTRLGARTLVDLRSTHECERAPTFVRAPLTISHVPLEDGLQDDPEFLAWESSGVLATPLYYGPFLARWADRCAAALNAVAEAPPGGVVVHCIKGSDRTGLIVALLLALLAVPLEVIVADYTVTAARVKSMAARRLGVPDDGDAIRELLAHRGTTAARALESFLRSLAVADTMLASGLSQRGLDALRRRLLE